MPPCRFTVSRLIKTDVINNRETADEWIYIMTLGGFIDYKCRNKAQEKRPTLRDVWEVFWWRSFT